MADVGLAIPKGKSTCSAELTGRRIEVVVRGVTALGLGIAVGGVAALGWWLASVRVDALNRRYARQQTLSRMTLSFHQQPWNRVGIQGVDVGRGLACDFAAIL